MATKKAATLASLAQFSRPINLCNDFSPSPPSSSSSSSICTDRFWKLWDRANGSLPGENAPTHANAKEPLKPSFRKKGNWPQVFVPHGGSNRTIIPIYIALLKRKTRQGFEANDTRFLSYVRRASAEQGSGFRYILRVPDSFFFFLIFFPRVGVKLEQGKRRSHSGKETKERCVTYASHFLCDGGTTIK